MAAENNFETPYKPSTTTTPTTENFISSFGVYRPEIGELVGEIFGKQSMTGMLEAMGAKRPVMQKSFKHYLEDRLHSKLSITTPFTPATANYASREIAVTPDSVKATRLNDFVWLTGNQRALVTAIGANTITVIPYQPWIVGLEVEGDIAIIGNEFEEMTGSPASQINGVLEYENTVMIIKESFVESGTSMTNATWFKTKGADGKEGYLYGLKGEKDTARRFANYMEMSLILGVQKNQANPNLGTRRGTEGLYEFCKKGTYLPLNNISGLNRAAIEGWLKVHDRLRGAKQIMFNAGYDASAQFDEAFAQEFGATQNGIRYADFAGGLNENQAIALGFDAFKRNGYLIQKRLYEPFSDVTTFNAGNVDFSKKILITPVSTTRDAITRETMPTMSIRFKANNMGYSRDVRVWVDGSQGLANATTDVDQRRVNYLTERGIELVGPNTFGLIEVS